MMQSRLSQPPMTSPAWILMRSFSGMLISSSSADCRSHGNSLHVGDCGGTPEHSNISRERGLQAGLALLPLQGLDQSRLLSADVGSGPTVDEQVEVVAAAAGVLAKEPSLVGLPDSDLEVAGLVVELSSDVDVSGPSPHGTTSHETALHESVRVVPHDLTVLAGAGLALVSVDHEVLGSAVTRLVHEGPLHAGREASAATASQPGGLDLVDD